MVVHFSMVAITSPRRSARLAGNGQVKPAANASLSLKQKKVPASTTRKTMKSGKSTIKKVVEKVVTNKKLPKEKAKVLKAPVEKKIKAPKVYASLSRDAEDKYKKPQHRFVCGVDEAGRGDSHVYLLKFIIVHMFLPSRSISGSCGGSSVCYRRSCRYRRYHGFKGHHRAVASGHIREVNQHSRSHIRCDPYRTR
jgi:hypothetical protein